jgi:uncharacterized protein
MSISAPRPVRLSVSLSVPVLLRISIAFGLFLAAVLPAQAQTRLETFERERLVIETSADQRYPFEVEMALTPRQQAQGLMYRRDLAGDAGMLFIYTRDRPINMWMKNTLIPLDMLFLARDGRVVRVVERAVPGSLRTISSGDAVAAVLEVNGGTASRLGIAPGDRVIHPALGGGS